MRKQFLDILVSEGILADGAIGTEIYKRGVFINRCFDELNISNPDLIKNIHTDYLDAGSLLLKTNTFTANRGALSSFGLDNKTREINIAGVKLARKVGGKRVFVAGSMGPVSNSASTRDFRNEWVEMYSEQSLALADAGADLILLETFTDLNELVVAIRAIKGVVDLPLVAQVSMTKINEDEYAGFQPEEAVQAMTIAEADVIGVNCSDGPHGVFETVKIMSAITDKPLSAMPNAGLPRMVQGRMLYMATPEYMGEYARRYAQLGVVLIGGCCGTRPEHIKEMKAFLKSIKPQTRIAIVEREVLEEAPAQFEPKKTEEKSPFGAVLGKKFNISVEVDPPMGIDPAKAVDGARFVKELGVDAVNIADGPRAMPRMSPIALSKVIKDRVGIEPIVHYCCRDRNILGMQMDLLGASALGLNNLLIITGDPPKMGNYPHATPVFDLDSVGLIRFVANLNRGLDFVGRPLKTQTSFVIGCGCNPGAVDMDIEVHRYTQKVEAGAEFVFSQPVYDMEMLEEFLSRIKGVKKIPFFAGILPISSLNNAEFLHNEVPGMQIPAKIMERLRGEETKEGQREVGIEVARDILSLARNSPAVQGAYIFPPLGKYTLVERLLGR